MKAEFELELCRKVLSRRPARHELLKKQSKGPNEKLWQAVMCHFNYKEEGKCLVFFFFWLINMMSFHVPNHIQVVSKSAFFVWNLLIQTKKPNKQNRDAQFWSPGAFNTAWNNSWPGVSRDACKMVFIAALQADRLTSAMCCQHSARHLHH